MSLPMPMPWYQYRDFQMVVLIFPAISGSHEVKRFLPWNNELFNFQIRQFSSTHHVICLIEILRSYKVSWSKLCLKEFDLNIIATSAIIWKDSVRRGTLLHRAALDNSYKNLFLQTKNTKSSMTKHSFWRSFLKYFHANKSLSFKYFNMGV